MNRPKITPVVLRKLVQVFFVLTSLFIGWRFYSYYVFLETSGMSGSPLRPAGVEAFIPLSSLVGLRSWLGTGVFDNIHPAGLVIFLTALIVSFLFRKSFCSWICPFGFLAEMLSKTGRRLFPRPLQMPRPLDLGLRSLKYILLAFFLGSVFFFMSAEAAAGFVAMPYNKLVDVKMLMFFLNISVTGLLIFGFLIIMSLFFDHFWCRYLCPYGALLGLAGWLSPSRITRSENLCLNCSACDKACPSKIRVSTTSKVLNPECNSCFQCIANCPVPGALEYTFLGRLGHSRFILPIAMLATFALAILLAKATGHWNSAVSVNEVTTLYRYIGSF